MTDISIVIPTYEVGGKGAEFLIKSFDKILNQTYRGCEVVISDHSVDDSIMNVCNDYSKLLDISYYRNENKRGLFAANLNNGIKLAKGKVIKMLMQDDYLRDDTCLEKTINIFEKENVKWAACGCYFGENEDSYHKMYATFDADKIKTGVNTIGSPSVASFLNEDVVLFDEELSWVVDLDYYMRINKKKGMPGLIDEYLIFIQRHPNQLTNTLSNAVKNAEESEIMRRFAK